MPTRWLCGALPQRLRPLGWPLLVTVSPGSSLGAGSRISAQREWGKRNAPLRGASSGPDEGPNRGSPGSQRRTRRRLPAIRLSCGPGVGSACWAGRRAVLSEGHSGCARRSLEGCNANQAGECRGQSGRQWIGSRVRHKLRADKGQESRGRQESRVERQSRVQSRSGRHEVQGGTHSSRVGQRQRGS